MAPPPLRTPGARHVIESGAHLRARMRIFETLDCGALAESLR
jgi:hypothetical protein